MYIRGRVCVKGCATMRPETFIYIFSLHNPTIFITFAIQKKTTT